MPPGILEALSASDIVRARKRGPAKQDVITSGATDSPHLAPPAHRGRQVALSQWLRATGFFSAPLLPTFRWAMSPGNGT